MQVHLVTVVGSDLRVFPFMLEHYARLGITSFRVNVHLRSEDDPALEVARAATSRVGCSVERVMVGQTFLHLKREVCDELAARQPDDWFVFADHDELQVYPEDLFHVLEYCDRKGFDYVRGCFLDRLGPGGVLPPVDSHAPIWGQFPIGAFVTYPISRGDPRKIVAAKGKVMLMGTGNHTARRGRACPITDYFVQVHHFKWVAGLDQTLRQRIQILRSIGDPVWIESRRFLDYFEAHGGRIDVRDPRFRAWPCTPEYRYWDTVRETVMHLESRESAAGGA